MFNNDIGFLEELLPAEMFEEIPGQVEENGDDLGDESLFNSDQEKLDQKPTGDHFSIKQGRVDSMLWAFRDVGYLYANLNPLGASYEIEYTNLQQFRAGVYEELTLSEFKLDDVPLDTMFFGGPAFKKNKAPLKDILEKYKKIYSSSIGVEFLHIQNKQVRRWLIENLEVKRDNYDLTDDRKQIIMEDLIETVEFERFLHRNFIGQKRFSIEGAEVIIPALHVLVDLSHENDIQNIIIGTTHRGRLSMLNRILNLDAAEIFQLFVGNYEEDNIDSSGDVKYHIGYSMVHEHEDENSVVVTLASNPSHLESVDPVVEGKCRAIQDKINDIERSMVLPILFHGDAAFSGQGVVAETLNLSQLQGYRTGGTIHIIINNQVGFTTSTRSSRSGVFTTDIAKAQQMPVFHVNGDNPEDVVRVMKMALRYRMEFKSDVVIDVICYRRYGHNEGDDPSFTHPKMYKLIEKHPSIDKSYGLVCHESGIMSNDEQQIFIKNYQNQLKEALEKARNNQVVMTINDDSQYSNISNRFDLDKCDLVSIPEQEIQEMCIRLNTIPDGFNIHPKLKRIIERKLSNYRENDQIDWALAESLAFGTMLKEGTHIRLSGQDSKRGTFSQRHLVWWEQNTDELSYFIPLNNLSDEQQQIDVYNSPLSEFSILGFEYGYSLERPDSLIIWEAQFGDFANGAQVIIDNYIAAAESKWNIRSGLVMFLPHGYEGQGPEHSSAHLERYLTLCANKNIQVCNVTTPAQVFALLRRQMKMMVLKPLILMTPKSLLRHPRVVSTTRELARGVFETVLVDREFSKTAKKALVCSGKIYYELLERVEQSGLIDILLVRLEQLYPFPQEELRELIDSHPGVKKWFWVQEEPQNRGAWNIMKLYFDTFFKEIDISYIGRRASASPAVGSPHRHQQEQESIITEAVGKKESGEIK
jgi:2-oxoglutarate dehydrogenase E1 component